MTSFSHRAYWANGSDSDEDAGAASACGSEADFGLPKVLLIGGLPRSGTTALADVVNESPDAAIMAEYRLTDLVYHLTPLLEYEENVHKAGASVAARARAGGSAADLVASPPASLAGAWRCRGGGERTTEPSARITTAASDTRSAPETFDAPTYVPFTSADLEQPIRFPTTARFPAIVANVVRTSLNKPRARIIGSKTPGTMLLDGGSKLAGMFPELRYVAMLRSPLPQINSSLNRRNRARQGDDIWHLQTVHDAISEYRAVICGLLALHEQVGDHLMFVKYEDLLSDPDATIGAVFAHIGSGRRPPRHPLATERGTVQVLSPAEQREVESSLGGLITAWDAARLTGTQVDLAIFNDLLPSVPKGFVTVAGEDRPPFLVAGWSITEPGGIWTDSASAIMIFRGEHRPACFLKLVFNPYLAAGNPLGMEVLVNGVSLGRTLLCPGNEVIASSGITAVAVPDWTEPVTLSFGPISLRADRHNAVEIRTTGAVSPASAGLGSDGRVLGIRLTGLHLVADELAART